MSNWQFKCEGTNGSDVTKRLRVAGVSFVGVLALCALARAQVTIPGYPASIHAFDPREVAMLPRFCMYTQEFRERVAGANDPNMIGRWNAELGPPFNHLHHYCYGLMKANRGALLARDSQARSFYLNQAVQEFDYVLERVPDDFVLGPELRTKKGESLMLLGKAPLAVFEFERAIELKKDYWPPYAQLSDHYKSVGDTHRARELLEAGLAQVPDARALQRRLAELRPAAEPRAAKR